MNVLEIVAKEIVCRFQKRISVSSSLEQKSPIGEASSAVTEDLATVLTRIWLMGSQKMDVEKNVGYSASGMEAMVDDMVRFLMEKCSLPLLSTLLLYCTGKKQQNSLLNKRKTRNVKHDAVTIKLLETVTEKRADATADEVLGDIAVYILHRFGELNNWSGKQHESDRSNKNNSVQNSPGGGGPDSTDATTEADANRANVSHERDHIIAYKEVTAALCTVLPKSQISNFMHQTSQQKQEQLDELGRIVWGMCVFNKEEGKTPSSNKIADSHRLLEPALADLEAIIRDAMERLFIRIEEYVALLTSPTASLTASERTLIKAEYYHQLLLLHNWRNAMSQLRALQEHIFTVVFPAYDKTCTQLRTLINSTGDSQRQRSASSSPSHVRLMDRDGGGKGKETLPKKLVYPLFSALCNSYEYAMRCTDGLEEVSALIELTQSSELFYERSIPQEMASEALAHRRTEMESPIDPAASTLAITALLEGAKHSLQKSSMSARYTTALPSAVTAGKTAASVVYPQSFFALRSICPVNFVDEDLIVSGVLGLKDLPEQLDFMCPPSNANCPGYVCVEGGFLRRPHFFAFTTMRAIKAFADSPFRYVQQCLHRTFRTDPAAALVTGLFEIYAPSELYIEGARHCALISDSPGHDVAQTDQGTQTGQIDSYFDRRYRWNEWDLRREALKLANLMNMRTHSTQTGASHFKRDNSTQVNPPKEMDTQTAHEAGVQPPRTIQYLRGLRGTAESRIDQVQQILYDDHDEREGKMFIANKKKKDKAV